MFYKPNNRIIIVDDVAEDLKSLSEVFYKQGVGCRTFLYDVFYDAPLSDVRIAFFDIEINPSGGSSDGQRFNSIALAIKQYIHNENGPFALIFWTKNKQDIENLLSYIEQVYPDCPRPFLIDCLDKAEFLLDPSGTLNRVLSDETMSLLFDFENIASKSASKTIDQLFRIIPRVGDTWGSNINFKVNFEKIFSSVCISALGAEHAKKFPDKAVREALVPILSHHISTNKSDPQWEPYLTSLKKTKLEKIADFDYSLLNSIFHIDTSAVDDPCQRGAVSKFFPFPIGGPPGNYFKRMEEHCEELFRRFIQFNDSEISVGDQNAFANQSQFIVIEISTACDFSQNKARNKKYILGLLTPNLEDEKLNYGRIGNSIFYKELPSISLNGKSHRIWINLNFTFSDFEINKNIGHSLFIFKKEITDMIGNRYANHASRIGITSFS